MKIEVGVMWIMGQGIWAAVGARKATIRSPKDLLRVALPKECSPAEIFYFILFFSC